MGVTSGVSGGGFSIGDDVGKGVIIKSGYELFFVCVP